MGQNFAKAFDIRYLDDGGELRHVHQTSWGVSTRMVGGVIMSHGDDKGLQVSPTLPFTETLSLSHTPYSVGDVNLSEERVDRKRQTMKKLGAGA